MKVLGIDPGTHRVGWGIVEGSSISQSVIDYGCVELSKYTRPERYLQQIHKEIGAIIDKNVPDLIGVERLFFQKNKKTAIQVAESRGVIMLAIAERSVPYVELAPNTVKSAVAGSGRATKSQVFDMVSLLLGLNDNTMLDDTADALAVAISAIVQDKHDQLSRG